MNTEPQTPETATAAGQPQPVDLPPFIKELEAKDRRTPRRPPRQYNRFQRFVRWLFGRR